MVRPAIRSGTSCPCRSSPLRRRRCAPGPAAALRHYAEGTAPKGSAMSNPMQMWSNWLELSARAVRLGWDAQNVIALRVMRLATGGIQGHRVTKKVLGVYEKRVRGNRRRLSR